MARTTKNLFDDGYTTRGDNGSSYRTSKDLLGDGYTSHGSDGSTYKTTKDTFGDGYTSYGNNGVSYKTTKDTFGDGYTTYGSDGSIYKSHKNAFSDGYDTKRITDSNNSLFRQNIGDISGSIAIFVAAAVILQICSIILTPMSYIYIATVIMAPKLSNIFARCRISRIWCSGVLFCFASFGAINSVNSDVSVVLGTQQGGESLITMIVLFMILLLGLMFAVFGMKESLTGFLAFLILFASIPWSYLDGLHHIPYTNQMRFYSIVILVVLALIDQIILLSHYHHT